jgi:hypothetical protein
MSMTEYQGDTQSSLRLRPGGDPSNAPATGDPLARAFIFSRVLSLNYWMAAERCRKGGSTFPKTMTGTSPKAQE